MLVGMISQGAQLLVALRGGLLEGSLLQQRALML